MAASRASPEQRDRDVVGGFRQDSDVTAEVITAAAQAVLDAAATHGPTGLIVLPTNNLDDVELVRETGNQDEPEGV